MCWSRGGTGGPGPPWKITKIWSFLAILDRIPWNTQIYQATTLGHHRHASETSFKCVLLAGQWWPALSDIRILSPLKKKKKRCQSSDPDQIRMEFRKECSVNLNIWACNRKHAKHHYCPMSDFVVQKPMHTRSISKYHFQHRYMILFEITRVSYARASLALSLLSLSLPPAFKVCK